MRLPAILMSNKPLIIVLLVLLASLVVNIAASLNYPAWMDEAIISDLVYDYFRDASYVPQNFLFTAADEGRIYGPVYFSIQTLFLHVFGDDPFVFRLSNLLAFYLLTGVIARLFLAHTGDKQITVWLAVLVLINFTINKNAVSGRMDMVATLFALLSLLCAYRFHDGSFRALLGSAVFACLAFLTTPRAMFLLAATVVLLAYSCIDQYGRKVAIRKIAADIAGAALVFLVPVGLWIEAVGGMREYVDLFLHPYIADFIGPSLFRNWRDWLYLPTLLGVMVMNWRYIRRDRLVVACSATIVAFSLFVHEEGPYRAMILPYFFLLGALAVGLVPDSKRRAVAAVTLASIILTVSIPFFVGRAMDTFYINRDCRDARDFEQRVLADIPMHFTFLADYRFYYLLKGRPAMFSPGDIETPDFFVQSGYPDRLLFEQDSITRWEETDSPFTPVLRDEYEVVTKYACTVHAPGLDDLFENRRNFHNATLYRRKPKADGATR